MYSWLLPHVTLIGGIAITVVILATMLRQRRSPASTLAWVLAIVLVPYAGVPLYLALGGRKLRRLAGAKSNLQFLPSIATAEPSDTDQLLRSYGLPGASAGNSLTLLGDGEATWAALVALIDGAERSIDVATYVLGNDRIGDDLVRRLARRAADGLEVRLLVDAIGSWRTPRSEVRPLIDAGGQVAWFMPLIRRPWRGRTNLRNHRKIMIADDRLVVAGGANLAEEYLGPTPLPGRWTDLSFRLEGPAVLPYADLFRSDWHFAAGGEVRPIDARVDPVGDAAIQVVPSGPDVPEDPLYATILAACFAARERLWTVTPYFVPGESLLEALAIAARRGVDVRLVIPRKSNQFLADLARGSYLRDLQRAGGRILLFEDGMLHAKVLLADRSLAMIGSANLDARSLFLNYEVACCTYTSPEIEAVATWIEDLFPRTKAGIPEVGPVRDLAEGVVRMVSPLL